MAAITVLGTKEFTAQPLKRSYVRGEGWTETQEWKGPPDKAEAKESELVALDPSEIDSVRGTPIATITVTNKPDDQDPETTAVWELIPSHLDKPLATHPAFAQSGVSAETIEEIEHAIMKGTAKKTNWNTESGLPFANDYRDLRLMGVESYRIFAYTIRKSFVISDKSAYQVKFTDVGKVIPYTAIGLPTVNWDQPGYVKWDGSTASIVTIDQWLVYAPRVRYEKRKYSVEYEWLGAEKWYSALYQGGSASADEHGFSQA
jgi:hypothetical protein